MIRELLKKGSGSDQQLLKLPTDKALLADPRFSQYVKAYAEVNFGWLCFYHLDQVLRVIWDDHNHFSMFLIVQN